MNVCTKFEVPEIIGDTPPKIGRFTRTLLDFLRCIVIYAVLKFSGI